MRETKTHLAIFLLAVVSLISSSCKKDTTQEQLSTTESRNELIAKATNWLDLQKTTATTYHGNKIDYLKAFLDFNELQVEKYKQNDQLIIIPVKEGFESGTNKGKNPATYLVLVLSTELGITKGNVIQFTSGTEHRQVPQNTFSKLFTYQDIAVDGKFAVLSASDRLLYELNFERGMLKSFSIKNKGVDSKSSAKALECIHWYWVTYLDGVEISREFLYSEGCETEGYPTPDDEDHAAPDIESPFIEYEVETIKTVNWKVHIWPNGGGEVNSFERLKGKSDASITGGGYFTDINHNRDECNRPGGTWGLSSATKSVSTSSAGMKIKGVWSEDGQNQNIENTKNWSLSDLF